jgi:hypothetical protein
MLLLSMSSTLWAVDGVTVSTSIKRQVEVVNEKGEKETVLEDVKNAVPGEELVVLISYVNSNDMAADNIVINNPLSDQMVYTAGSAEGETTVITFSVDGGKSFDMPENLFVVQDNDDKRPAVPADYTHILWKRTVPLAPGQEASVRFRAVIR